MKKPTKRVLFRNGDGLCTAGTVRVNGSLVPVTAYDTEYIRTGETTQVRGWGELDGRVSVFKHPYSANEVLIPNAELEQPPPDSMEYNEVTAGREWTTCGGKDCGDCSECFYGDPRLDTMGVI